MAALGGFGEAVRRRLRVMPAWYGDLQREFVEYPDGPRWTSKELHQAVSELERQGIAARSDVDGHYRLTAETEGAR